MDFPPQLGGNKFPHLLFLYIVTFIFVFSCTGGYKSKCGEKEHSEWAKEG